MGGHAIRGALTAWMGLIVLYSVGTANGSGRIAGLFTDVNNLLTRALDANVPAIPDRRGLRGSYDADGNFHPSVPGYLGGGEVGGENANPDFDVVDPPPPGGSEYYDNYPSRPGGIDM
jgi:hypothetical protein